MKKILLPLIVLLAAACSSITSPEEKPIPDIYKMGLKGQIESFSETYYSAVIRFGNIEHSSADSSKTYIFNSTGYLTSLEVLDIPRDHLKKTGYSYNSRDQITEISRYRNNDRLIDKKKFSYNDFHKLSEMDLYYSDGTLNMRWDLYYDGKQRLEAKNEYEADGKLVRKYGYRCNAAGQIMKELTFRPDMSIEQQTTYNYDTRGRLIQKSIFSMDGRHYTKWTYEYTDADRLASEAYFDQRQAVLRFYTRKDAYIYNQQGDVIEKQVYNSERLLTETWKYVYDYDENNNWIKQTRYVNSVPTLIIERTINNKK